MESTCQPTAMMFTDIVGSTAVLGKDSARPLEVIRINWGMQKPHVEKHGRKWRKELDDGATAQFNRALDAVNCAVEIQKLALSLLIFLVLVGTFWSISASAQNYIDLLRIEYSGSMGNDFDAGSGAADIHHWVVDATIPFALTEKNTLLTGILFESTQTALYAGQEKSSVYTLNLKLGLNKKYSETWSASYLFLPKLSSDLQNISSDDFQFGAAALLKFTKNKNLNFKFGAFYNSDNFGPFISPLVGLYYQHNQWEYNILVPRTVDINYQIVAPLKLGLRFNGYIKSFNLNNQFQGKAQYVVQSNNDIGVYLGWSLGKIELLGMLGHSIGRNYRTYEQGDELGAAIFAIKLGDDRTQLNTDFKDGLVFKTSLIYRFDLDD